MTITISCFAWVPPFAQGQVRDLRVRWALEEAGLAYDQRVLRQGDQSSPEYCALQPFGQVPIYQEGDLTLFETGAIVHHVAQKSPVLLPDGADDRARMLGWICAALSSVEPFVMNVVLNNVFERDEPWSRERRPHVEAFAGKRLDMLAAALGDRDWLLGRFTAADILMATVVRILGKSRLVRDRAPLAAYVARAEARPAFTRALAAQMAVFAENEPQA